MVSNAYEIEKAVLDADLVIGAVLVAGAKAPKLVTNELVSRMKPGSVLVDISIDQGGCFEDSRPTTHADPTYTVHNSVFYCVANMPGAVPHTSTYALTNVTLPYAVELANKGWRQALRDDASLAKGLNVQDGVGHLRAGRRGARAAEREPWPTCWPEPGRLRCTDGSDRAGDRGGCENAAATAWSARWRATCDTCGWSGAGRQHPGRLPAGPAALRRASAAVAA